MGLVWGIIIAILVLGGGYFLWARQSDVRMNANTNATSAQSSDTEATASGTASGTNTGTTAGTYTSAQVASHNSSSSCWSIVDGNVYDLTSWIGLHPGGAAAIQQLCGKDGTALFHGQHGTAAQQAEVLASMKIGALAR